MSKVVTLPNNSCKPVTNTAWVRDRFCKLQKGCNRLAATSDNAYQLLPVTTVSATTKIGRHDIAEILPQVELSTIHQIKSNQLNRSILTQRQQPQSIYINSLLSI
jgi:hypothetical protein